MSCTLCLRTVIPFDARVHLEVSGTTAVTVGLLFSYAVVDVIWLRARPIHRYTFLVVFTLFVVKSMKTLRNREVVCNF